MRIAILTSGRFHVCDLARELDQLGHEVAFYTLTPPWRTRSFGLPDRCHRWVLPLVAAPFALARARPRSALAAHAAVVALDHAVASVLKPCDVLIHISGLGLHTMELARRRYGAKLVVERGSRHILSQREILEGLALPGAPRPVPDWAVHRELAEYQLADLVTVPSRHVVESFLERGFSEQKLFRNRYGVSLAQFPPTPPPPPGTRRILMTGAWSRRKGCDLLAEAWRGLDAELVHVGPVTDAALPREPGFTHLDAVDQRELSSHYAHATVFSLASHEEGLALVTVQALASGLRLVCSDRTGAADLAEVLDPPYRDLLDIVPAGDVPALRAALQRALDAPPLSGPLRDPFGGHREELSWSHYGRRYDARLRSL